ncbi:MAG: sigma factor-like helix-turn-helix DNA-binding protein [Candidatus Omnitrophota bacterium]
MNYNDEERLQSLIIRYQQKVFALVFYLIGGDQDKTYDICASSFAEAARVRSSLEHEEAFLITLIGIAIERSRAAKTIPVSNELGLLELPDAEKGPLRMVLKALRALDFDAKALVLLRDQLNLSYSEIAAIMRSSESTTRPKVTQARARLRKMIEDTLHYA